MRTLAFLLMVLVIAACTSSDDTQDSAAVTTTVAAESATVTTAPTTTTTVAATTTAAPTTTTTTPPTTTTAAPTTTTAAVTTTTSGGPYLVGAPDLYPLMALPGSAGAAGSGCAPGAGPLPDGVWFGIVSVIGATSVDFDLACFYFGDIAYTKGAEDGQEVNNDYYIRNMNPTLRTVPVAAGATVHELAPGYTGFVTEPYAAWPADTTMSMVCPSSGCLVWVFVNGGVATEILEQFTP